MPVDLVFGSIAELAPQIKDGRVSPVAVVEAGLDGLGQTQPARMPDDGHLWVSGRQFGGRIGSVVSGAVVDDQNFEAAGKLGEHVQEFGDL